MEEDGFTSFADAVPARGNGDAGAVNKAFHKILNDPELFEIYEKARIEQTEPEYNREVVPRLLEVRDEYNQLLDTWDTSLPDYSARLAELRAEERRLLAEFRGSRKVGETEPLRWLAEKVWPNGANAKCPKCLKGRHVETEELSKWIKYGTPKCRKCGVEITLN
jgi:hypothetical protein